MTNRGMKVVALVVVALFALSATALAQQTPRPLSVKTAKKFARGLGKQQKRENDVVVFHFYDMKRVNRDTITFKYDERTKTNGYCTAILRVKQTQHGNTTRITARLLKHSCALIPRDALATERATRRVDRRVRRNERSTLKALRRVQRSLAECESLDPPRNRRRAVAAVIDTAVVGALRRPNNGALASFVAALGNVETNNARLARGAEAWADYLDALRSLPTITDPCETLRTWENADWAADEAPIDMAAYRQLEDRADADVAIIGRAARYLARVGILPRLVLSYTPDGLILKYAQD
jgi:hypothetical protein